MILIHGQPYQKFGQVLVKIQADKNLMVESFCELETKGLLFRFYSFFINPYWTMNSRYRRFLLGKNLFLEDIPQKTFPRFGVVVTADDGTDIVFRFLLSQFLIPGSRERL